MGDINSGVSKSKRFIRKAFIELLRDRSFKEITVKDITERSELGRTTFYLHYKDKEDLLNELTNNLISGFVAIIEMVRGEGLEAFMEQLALDYHPRFTEYFRYFRANRDVFSVLVKKDCGVDLAEQLIEALYKMDLSIYITTPVKFDVKDERILRHKRFLISNYVNIFMDWIKNGMYVSDEGMATVLTLYWRGFIFPIGASTSFIENLETSNS